MEVAVACCRWILTASLETKITVILVRGREVGGVTLNDILGIEDMRAEKTRQCAEKCISE